MFKIRCRVLYSADRFYAGCQRYREGGNRRYSRCRLHRDRRCKCPRLTTTVKYHSCKSQISRLTPQQAHMTLTTLSDRPLPESSEDFTGLIRIADIRLTERDKVKMGECFRLGDIVKAKVVSFSQSLNLTGATALKDSML